MDSRLIPVKNSLDLESISPRSPLHRILANSLADITIYKRTSLASEEVYWDASFFGLDKVRIFKQMNDRERIELLKLSTLALLEEATFVEKSATCFTSKMTLLSYTIEERMLYSLFAAEEVGHYHAMLSYLPNGLLRQKINPFIALLNQVLEEADKTVLTFIIQVVLEGWGLSHFASLGEACKAKDLQDTFRWFVKHEARHHGSGVLLFNQEPASQQQIDTIVEIMLRFLHMIQIGPQMLLSGLCLIKGDLSISNVTEICVALDCERVTKSKLEKLRFLMHGGQSKIIIERLEKYGAFSPEKPEVCARAITEWNK